MPIDPKRVAMNRRLAIASLQDKKLESRQRAEQLQGAVRDGFKDVRLRIQENDAAHSHHLDLFPTPEELAERMVKIANISEQTIPMRVLEPSAGTGRIARAIRKAGIEPTCIEYASTPISLLREQNFNVLDGDFLRIFCEPHLKYDAILMNPPFSNDADMQHVLHAFNFFLKDNGVIVAIMSAGVKYRERGYAPAFRKWLEAQDHRMEDLPSGTFKSSGTNVSTILVSIWR